MQAYTKPLVLIVDDDQYSVSSVVNQLVDLGCEVYLALSLDQAITFLEKYGVHIDIAILDIMIPDGEFFKAFETKGGFYSGVTLGRHISLNWPNIQLIAYSVLANEQEVKDFFESRFLGGVCKSEQKRLINKVAKELGLAHSFDFEVKRRLNKVLVVLSGVATLIAIIVFFTGYSSIYEIFS